jgi:hypothetical protein
MKKTYLSLIALTACAFTSMAQTDLGIGNFDAGYAYNSSTGMISDIYFTIVSNENSGATNFKVGIYFVPSGATTLDDAFLLDSKTVPSISGNAAIDVEDWDIDVNQVEEIESGNYRLLVAVDYDEKVSENNEDNNNLFISSQGNDLSYTKKGGNTGIPEMPGVSALKVYPNPAAGNLNISIAVEQPQLINCSINDITGKVLSTYTIYATSTGSLNSIDISSLPKGVYTLQLNGSKGSIMHKFIKL